MKLLTGRAQIFADVRTYWSPEAVKKATGYDLEGVAKEAGGFLHLINSGAACLDANGQAKEADGNTSYETVVGCYRGRPESNHGSIQSGVWPTTDTSVEADTPAVMRHVLRCLQL